MKYIYIPNAVQRLDIYKRLKDIIKNRPVPDSIPEDINDIDMIFRVNFCLIFSLVEEQLYEKSIGLNLFLFDLPELSTQAPSAENCWTGYYRFWFHPYAKEPRLAMLDKAIAEITSNLKWYDKLRLQFNKIW